ncbi:MAG: fibronectin type III domain-containing protein, partial [Thaumarchaeota archaeon]|nr:fibronectin type III domain-containing protein [Nitrososphaerota archaeon]
DPNFVTGINNMKAAGITVIGYVDTAYGSRSISQVKTEINNWSNWYHVNGIFFDEMDNSAGGESYYSTATSYAKSLGMTMTVGNPGTSTDSSYIGTVDNIVIYETTGTPSLSTLLSYTFNGLYSKSNFSFIAYSVSSLPSASYLASAANDVSYIYITNAGGSNPYDVLPSYFSTEVADLDTGSGSTATVPSAPTGLTANTGNAQAVLSWIAPSSNGGSAISGYNVYRGTTSGGENTTPIATGIASTTYTDTGLTNGQVYYYVVKAVNSIGTSSSSNEANVTPVTSVTAPSAPTGLTANAASSSQINLNWTAPTNNGGSAITGYKIDRSIDGGTTWSNIVSNTASTSTTYTDTNLSSSTTYTYQVSSINSVGTSLPSNTVSATTGSGGGTTTGNIVLNNVQSTSGTVSSSYKITLSNFNVGTGNDRLLVVGVSANNNNVASITFGGVPLAMKTSSFYNNDAEFWYLKNPTGTGNIVVTMAGPTQVVVGAYSFSGVNQTSPLPNSVIRHNTAASSPSISLTTTYPNDLVLDLPSIYGGTTLNSSTCSQQWDVNMPSAITGASSSTLLQSPAAVTCGWTASGGGDLWDDAAVEIMTDTQ